MDHWILLPQPPFLSIVFTEQQQQQNNPQVTQGELLFWSPVFTTNFYTF